jgi:hypothetical protein
MLGTTDAESQTSIKKGGSQSESMWIKPLIARMR